MIVPISDIFEPCTPSGSVDRIIYSGLVKPDFSIELVETGRINIQDKINSFAESTSLPSILARFAAGDTAALSVHTPLYGDFTNFPTTYAEVLQKDIEGKRLFYSLSPEIQRSYDNDYNKFIADSVNPGFEERSGLFRTKVDSTPVPDIKQPIKEVIADA